MLLHSLSLRTSVKFTRCLTPDSFLQRVLSDSWPIRGGQQRSWGRTVVNKMQTTDSLHLQRQEKEFYERRPGQPESISTASTIQTGHFCLMQRWTSRVHLIIITPLQTGRTGDMTLILNIIYVGAVALPSLDNNMLRHLFYHLNNWWSFMLNDQRFGLHKTVAICNQCQHLLRLAIVCPSSQIIRLEFPAFGVHCKWNTVFCLAFGFLKSLGRR